jgi:hypothetical protein
VAASDKRQYGTLPRTATQKIADTQKPHPLPNCPESASNAPQASISSTPTHIILLITDSKWIPFAEHKWVSLGERQSFMFEKFPKKP